MKFADFRMELIPSSNRQEMNTKSSENVTASGGDEKLPPPQDHAPKCPRCDSGNTKFCYYNNYSLSQPRYFCKSCRRHWTKGGTLRNMPIGGGYRKNKRSAKRSYNQLLLQSQEENNLMLTSSLSGCNTGFFSKFSSPLSYEESSGSDGSLSMAFARLQKQCTSDHGRHLGLGFEFESQNVTQAPPIFGNPITTSNVVNQKINNLGHLSDFFETDLTNQTSSLHNSGSFENYGHSQQPLLPYEDLLTASSFNLMSGPVALQQEMSDNKILREFPWQNGGLSSENDHTNINNNNLVIGSSKELVAEAGVGESWSNMTELAPAQTWPNP